VRLSSPSLVNEINGRFKKRHDKPPVEYAFYNPDEKGEQIPAHALADCTAKELNIGCGPLRQALVRSLLSATGEER
jgi:hypothetical protein